MRTLHVAALPFPSPQGTQGLIHAMLSALTAHGHDAHLLCYAHGAGMSATPTYPVHRAAGRARGSLRSGPSLAKLAQDVALARAIRQCVRRLRPRAVVAHHVEAAACALALGARPMLFVAHTSLQAELPSYVGRALAGPAAWAGRRLDVSLVRRAPRTLAVSPLLARLLTRASGRAVHTLTLPWPQPSATDAAERRAARRALGIAEAEQVLLYAGNLDGYQGLEPMLAGVAQLALPVRLLIATSAPHAALAGTLARLRSVRVTFAPLASEPERRCVHAASDLALVPRRSPGGVPIKLLEALARGVPVVAARRALAELPLAPYCESVDGGCTDSWRAAITRVLAERPHALRRALAARQYVSDAHAPARFARCFEAHVDELR